MSQFFSFDPGNGITAYTDYDHATDKMIVRQEQDVEPLLDHTKSLANEGLTDKSMKDGMWLYAQIPPVVIMELKKKGINIYNRDDHKRLFQELNTNYKYLKTTSRTHV